MQFEGLWKKIIFAGICGAAFFASRSPAAAVNFEDVSLSGGYYNGSDGVGGFVSENQFFRTPYNAAWFSWENVGCTNSTLTDEPTRSVDDEGIVDWLSYYASVFPDREFSGIAGSGNGGSSQYAIAFPSFSDGMAHIVFQQPVQLADVAITNTDFVYYSIRDGNQYCRAFHAGDFYYVTITGRDIDGNATGSFDYYLADYRNGAGTIINVWQTLSLSNLGPNVKSLDLAFTSSDSSSFGANTPTYCALDDLHIVGNPLGASWVGGGPSNSWGVAANWTGGVLPTPGQSLLFDSPNDETIHNGEANHLAGAITFGSHAGTVTLTGEAVHLTYDLSNLSTKTQTVDLPLVLVGGNQSVLTGLGDVVITQPISEDGGSFGLTKTGVHTLTLSAANTYTGATNITEGTVLLTDGGDISTASAITVSVGAIFEIGSGSHEVGAISGPGTTIVDGDATLTATSIRQSSLVIGAPPHVAAVPEPGALFMLLTAMLGAVFAKGIRCG